MIAYERVKNARSPKRPGGAYYISRMIDSFTELHGDRRFSDDGAIIGGIGYLDGQPVTVIAMERGSSFEDRMKRNFGCPNPEGYRKALRLMKQAEKFKRPVICIINSPGAYCGIGAEERGQGLAIAENLYEMSTLKTPIISVVCGEGGSGGALALSVADDIIMLENAVYSVISPEGCASILWKDASKADEAAKVLRLTADDLLEFGMIDGVIREDEKTAEQITAELKAEITKQLSRLKQSDIAGLLDRRYAKFRKIGQENKKQRAKPLLLF